MAGTGSKWTVGNVVRTVVLFGAFFAAWVSMGEDTYRGALLRGAPRAVEGGNLRREPHVRGDVVHAVAFAPDVLSPLGSLASIVLLIVPSVGLVLVRLFEALIPPSYVEGAIEGMQFTTQREHTTLHLYAAGRRYRLSPSAIEGRGGGRACASP